MLVERVQDGVGFVQEALGADGTEGEAQVVQEKVHGHLGAPDGGRHGWAATQDQGGGVDLAALHVLEGGRGGQTEERRGRREGRGVKGKEGRER